jgi:hypothetical protein
VVNVRIVAALKLMWIQPVEMQCVQIVVQFWKTALLSLKFSLKRMHMGVVQHWGSLFHLTLKEVQEGLEDVSDQTLIILIIFYSFIEYVKK